MARLIYFGVELSGHINGSIGLIKKLIDKGEEVIYYCSENYRQIIEGTGATFRSYGDIPGSESYNGNGIETFFVFAEFLIEKSKRIINEFIDDIKTLQPDYIIHDAFCCWGKEFSKILNIPGISFTSNYPFTEEMSEVDPRLIMDTILRVQDDPMYKIYKDNPLVYKKLIKKITRSICLKHNLSNISIINDIFGSKEKLNILFTSKEFQLYSETFDESYIYCGYHSLPDVRNVEFPFEKLSNRLTVYICFGTIFNNKIDFYKRCIEAFSNSDMQVILSVGNNVNIEELGYIPDNIIVRNFVPQIEILKIADVFITHGGTNSVYEAICNHVPMVVIPQAFDQFMGSIMIKKSETGIYINNEDVSVSQLKNAVEEVINNKSYKDNCVKINKSLKATGGLDYAVDAIFKYLGR